MAISIPLSATPFWCGGRLPLFYVLRRLHCYGETDAVAQVRALALPAASLVSFCIMQNELTLEVCHA